MSMTFTKSCGHDGNEWCDCPVVDEVWIVPPAHKNCRASLVAGEETHEKVARILLAGIERRQWAETTVRVNMDGTYEYEPRGRRNGKSVKGYSGGKVVFDEISNF